MKQLVILTLFIFFLSGLLTSGCEDNLCNCYCDSYDALALPLNDTVDLKYSELYCNPENELRISFDSLSDSRCPIGATCFWEGNASFRITIKSDSNESNSFKLNTHANFLTDTVVNGLHYELIDVFPYPKIDKEYQLDDYILQLIISH